MLLQSIPHQVYLHSGRIACLAWGSYPVFFNALIYLKSLVNYLQWITIHFCILERDVLNIKRSKIVLCLLLLI